MVFAFWIWFVSRFFWIWFAYILLFRVLLTLQAVLMKRRSSSCLLTHDARKRFILPLFVLALVAFIFIHIFVYVCNCHWDCGAVSVAHISSSDHNVEKNSLSFMRSKRALLVSHELSLSGGPLLLIELAFLLRNVGTQVIWITCQKPAKENKISHSLEHKMTSRGVQVLSARGQEAVDVALRVDIIVLNTAVTGKWLDVALNKHLTQAFPKILWWIHEMRGHYFKLDYVKHLPFVKVAMIDSNTTAEYWKNRTHERLGIQMPKTYVVHLGNSNEFMEIAEDYITRRILKEHIRESLGIGAEDLVFAIINSVSRGKGQDLFLQSFYESLQLMQKYKAKVPAIYAIVVGSDMDAQTKFEGELRNFVASKGIQGRVHFVNKTLTVAPYLAAIDVLVQNSQGRGECFGRITIEAMAFQLPVLGTAAGGTAEIVVDGLTGLLHPTGKEGVSYLAKNIVELATYGERRLSMGKEGYLRVKERFMEHHMAARIASVFKLII